ncbi:MAG TPA: acetoacetate decarboxylase family protein [Solirubrobacteraceae bacterium]|jgi:hypothetical protein
MRSVLTALGAALALAVLAPAGAAAQEGEDSGGAGVEIRSVSTIAPLRTDTGARAAEVYRALIPDGLQMPAQPAVGVWLADLAFGANRGRPTDEASHWLEGAVQIRVRFGDVEGWYPIHYPVTAEFWFNAGRYVGLPKRHAAAAIVPAGAGWSATATPRGTTGGPSFAMDWQPAAGQDPAALERAFRIPSEPLLVLNKPLQGPDLMRVQYSLGKPGFVVPGGPPAFDPDDPQPEPGLVRLRVREDLDALQEPDLPKLFPAGASLADLIAPDQTLPGTHKFATVALGSTSETIGEGGYRPPASGGPAPAPAPAPRAGDPPRRSCRHSRRVTVRFRRFRGAKLRRVRVYVDGRRVKPRGVRGRRVRVRVRGRRGRTHRVTVVAVQSHGIRIKTRRRVRLCA